MSDKKQFDFTANSYDRKAEALRAVEKNFYVSAACMLLIGGALILFMSKLVAGIVCIVLSVVCAIFGFVIVRKEGILSVDEKGIVSFSKDGKSGNNK